MNQCLIDNWNRVVGKDDEIYCLGDFGWQLSPDDLKSIMSQLNGKKYLISGNHDKQKMHIKSQMWEEVDYYKHLKIDKKRVILCHYPIFDFDSAYHKSIHLFGHIHDQPCFDEIKKIHTSKGFYSYCVCVDFNNYTPISFEDILQKINYQTE
jgi:calcineurin-like phosphoesterase family protein